MTDMDCALGRIDPPALAWAAGFFDGEGSTVAAVRLDRPRYRRLEVTVPQCGHDGLPEVLLRFQASLLGMGNITGPNDDDMYFWRASGFVQAQAAVALMWEYLGSVKRAQAAAAMRAVHQQYASGLYRSRGPRRPRTAHAAHDSTQRSAVSSREIDVAWAAGFLDGEGHFGLPRSRARLNAPDWHRVRVSATQNGAVGRPPEVLYKLQRILGGKIERHGEPDDFRWLNEGLDRVEHVLHDVHPWLGTVKQGQAHRVIDGFRSQVRMHGDATHCARGHAYSHVYMGARGPKRRCNSCARILSRMKRAAQGIKPRQFRDVARRYTF